MKNLTEFVKAKNLKIGDVAKALWKNAKHPRHALYHHQKVGAELTESQLMTLSLMSNTPVDTILAVSIVGMKALDH